MSFRQATPPDEVTRTGYARDMRPKQTKNTWCTKTESSTGRWLLCTWLLAISGAILCSSAKQLDPLFGFNLFGCVFSLQARRALRARLPKQGRGAATQIQAYYVLVPGEGRCLFYAVSTEVSGGQKWELSCAIGSHHVEDGTVSPSPPDRVIAAPREKEAAATPAAEALQARIQSNVVHVPGDGWCFFYTVSKYFKGGTNWDRSAAAEIYLQAIEWLLAAQHGPQADAVATACVPFNADELRLHEHFLRQQPTAVETAALNTTEVVLLSKLHALLPQPAMLDSIHHASAGVELWALTQQFEFECLIWGSQENVNYWVRSMDCLTDQEAHAKLQHHSPVLELVHAQAEPQPAKMPNVAWKGSGAQRRLACPVAWQLSQRRQLGYESQKDWMVEGCTKQLRARSKGNAKAPLPWEDLSRAATVSKQAKEAAHDVGDVQAEAAALCVIAQIHVFNGRPQSEILETLEDAMALAVEAEDGRTEATALLLKAEIHLQAEELQEALNAARQAELLLGRMDDEAASAKVEEILNKLRGFEFRVDEAPVAPAYRSYGYDPRMALPLVSGPDPAVVKATIQEVRGSTVLPKRTKECILYIVFCSVWLKKPTSPQPTGAGSAELAELGGEVDVVKKISEMEQKAQVWQGDLDQELHRLNRQLNEQTSQVETLKRHLDQKKRPVLAPSLFHQERGFEDARAAQLREREELLQAKEKQLREREELLQAKEKQLLEREQTLQREKKLLHEREQSFIAKERQLLEREQTLQTEKKLQMEREQYLQSKDQQLFEREEALQSATKLQQQQELEHFQTERQLERARAKSQDYNLTAPAPAAPAPPAAPRGRKTEPRGPRGPRGAVKDRSSRSREREMKQKDPEHRKTKRRRTELYRTFEEQRWTWYKTLATPIATPSPAAAVTAAVTARSAAASRHVEPVKPKVDREEADPPLHRLGSARPILLETVEEELMLELDEVSCDTGMSSAVM
ncbi:unnamed protein product [Durusdinium trenchii]|uniref:OTU domain-containing protein n=1 Tax=Durusdinium trenchii TaxID=1381693 RepID=A0ABP0IG77_9DINO